MNMADFFGKVGDILAGFGSAMSILLLVLIGVVVKLGSVARRPGAARWPLGMASPLAQRELRVSRQRRREASAAEELINAGWPSG
ncbi:MAG: hypothetical protein LBD97_01190 [Bifidobacteriaceae bacterium]|jgi:hypothetical protein|nr:hypothetical protein [Bifidobacteriaceae bacterium]